tara:strand:- start:3274 stop:3798 length:525 start_codon:yes stop_codon:yes gene_type:complete
MKLTPKHRIIICIIGQILLLISALIPTILLANKDSTYYRFGPSEELIIISIKINTWTRYAILLVYILIFRICKVFVTELGMPILSFNIYDPNRKKVKDFTRKELQILANIMFMLNAIRYALTLQLYIIQIDIALLSGIFSELASIPTIYILLKDKVFEEDVKSEELKEELISTI